MIFEPLKLVRTLSFEDLNYLVLYHPPRCVPGAHLRLRSPGSNGEDATRFPGKNSSQQLDA